MKKRLGFFSVIVFLISALLVAGCTGDAAVLKDAMEKSMETESSRKKSELKIVNNVPSDQLNQQALAAFSMLEQGVTMEVEMESLTATKMVVTVSGDDLLRMAGIWDYSEQPAVEFITKDNSTAFKTSADSVYLIVDPEEAAELAGEDANVSTALPQQQEAQVDAVMNLMRHFISEFDFEFSDIQHLGTEEVELPDGTYETEVIEVNLDFEEKREFLIYTLEFLQQTDALKEYMEASLQGIETEENISEEAYKEVQNGIGTALEFLSSNSADDLKEKYGLDFSSSEKYYIDSDKNVRKTVSEHNIKAEHETFEQVLGTKTLDITIHDTSTAWDINEPVEVEFPGEDESVSFISLIQDPSSAENLGDGPLSFIAKALAASAQQKGTHVSQNQLVINMDTKETIINGQPTEFAVSPYIEEGRLMVPVYAVAETAGAQLNWDSENSQIIYNDGQNELKVSLNSDTAVLNGEEITLDKPAVLKENRIFVSSNLVESLAESTQKDQSFILYIF